MLLTHSKGLDSRRRMDATIGTWHKDILGVNIRLTEDLGEQKRSFLVGGRGLH